MLVKWIPLVILTFGPLVAGPGASLEEGAATANIVLIVSDDQGYRDLSCAGSPDIRTPNLDRLATEGVRLTNFYVTWPACTPSRASLLTGRYPQRNGTYDMIRNDLVDYGHQYTQDEYAVSPERVLGTDVRELLISSILERAGYVNGCFGKWDGGQLLRFLPLQRGFHAFYGFTNTGIDYYTHERYGIPSMRRGNHLTEEDKGTYATLLFRREALSFLDTHHRDRFFLYLPFNAPHGASNLDPETRGRVQAPRGYLDLYPPAGSSRETRRREYMAAVSCMDEAIGAVLDQLDAHGIADRTLVVFLSDNGGGGLADNYPLRGQKSWLFEGGIRVPCLVRWPGKVPAGKIVDQFLTSLEILPTLLVAAGMEVPHGLVLDGFNMLPVLQGREASKRREMFWKRRDDWAARVGDWKYVESERGRGLFDLSVDAEEQDDLSGSRPQLVKMIRERYARWLSEMEASEARGPFRDF